jgi:hypothetical protein
MRETTGFEVKYEFKSTARASILAIVGAGRLDA